MPNDENAIGRLATAIGRIDAHVWPREYIGSVRQLFDGLSEITCTPYDDSSTERIWAHVGGARGSVLGHMQDHANLAMHPSGPPQHSVTRTDDEHGARQLLP